MIAMLVEIDGERFVLAGVDDWSILSAHINARRGRDNPRDPSEPDDYDFSVGGLTEPDSHGVRHHFRWPRRELRIGSTIKVTLVESESGDEPKKRYRSDREIQESPYTDEEMRELRRQDYLALKREFEGGADG